MVLPAIDCFLNVGFPWRVDFDLSGKEERGNLNYI